MLSGLWELRSQRRMLIWINCDQTTTLFRTTKKARKMLVKNSFYYTTHIAISYKGFRIFYSKIVTSLMQYDNERYKNLYPYSLSTYLYRSPDTLLNNEIIIFGSQISNNKKCFSTLLKIMFYVSYFLVCTRVSIVCYNNNKKTEVKKEKDIVWQGIHS